MPAAKVPPSNYVHIVLFENSKKKGVSRYKVVINGEDLTAKFGGDTSGFINSFHLDWEGKYHVGVNLRNKTGLEPLFYHKVYLEGGKPNSSFGYGRIKSYYHDSSPKEIYETVLELSRQDNLS